MTNGVRESREHPLMSNDPSTKREKGEGRGTRRCAPERTSPISPLPVLWNIAPLQSEQVHKQPIRAGNASGQLPEEAQAGVHIRATTQRRDQEAALELRHGLSRIVRLEHRHVRRVPGAREIEAALLHPAA